MNTTEHLLTILAEESAEVAQSATKALRFGFDEVEPGKSLNNRERIVQELNDVFAIAEMLGLCHADRTAIDRKKAKILEFMGYAEKCGTLDASQPQP